MPAVLETNVQRPVLHRLEIWKLDFLVRGTLAVMVMEPVALMFGL